MSAGNLVKTGIVLAVGLGSLPAAARATSAGTVATEIGMAAFLEGSAALFGYQIISTSYPRPGGPGPEYYDTVASINPFGITIGVVLFAAYPLSAAAGTYLLGEKVDGPAVNKGAAFGAATLAAYWQTLFLAFGASMIGMAEGIERSEALQWAFWADVTTKPLVTTYVYNRIKKPARGPRPREGRLAVDAYVCAVTASDGQPLPLYGLSISF